MILICIKKVKIKGKAVNIYVSQKEPGKDEMVDDVLTYPVVKIKFYKSPSLVTVLDYETGEIFHVLN